MNEAAREFLFAVQLQFDFAAPGDVHQGSLMALNAAGSIPDASRGVEASNGRAVAAAQGDLVPVDGVGMREFGLFGFPLTGMEEEFGKRMTDDFFPFFVAEHARKGGIDILEIALGGGEIDAFLKGQEEFGEAGLVFTLLGDVTGQGANTLLLAVAHEGVQGALEESRGSIVLEANAHDAGPVALLKQAGKGAFSGGAAGSVHQLNELVELAADERGKGVAQEIGDAAIGGKNLALERNGKEQVLESIDEITIALLRPLHHLEQLFQLS